MLILEIKNSKKFNYDILKKNYCINSVESYFLSLFAP